MASDKDSSLLFDKILIVRPEGLRRKPHGRFSRGLRQKSLFMVYEKRNRLPEGSGGRLQKEESACFVAQDLLGFFTCHKYSPDRFEGSPPSQGDHRDSRRLGLDRGDPEVLLGHEKEGPGLFQNLSPLPVGDPRDPFDILPAPEEGQKLLFSRAVPDHEKPVGKVMKGLHDPVDPLVGDEPPHRDEILPSGRGLCHKAPNLDRRRNDRR